MSALLLAAALFPAAAWRANAQSTRHLSVIQPGGIPGIPVLTGITRVTNGVKVTWDSPAGYCQLQQKRNLKDPAWQAIGTPYNLSGFATVSNLYTNAFFRVFSPPPQYAGAQPCAECHADVLNTFLHTAHASTNIFTNSLWVAQGGWTNGSCLACHTVGYNLPTGFTSQTTTPQLAGVQCENCHGPAANHATNPDDPTAIPRVELAATMCGGCHNAQYVPASAAASHPPYYEEWNASPHRAVLDELKTDFADPARGTNFYIPNCGPCHSGTVRAAYLNNQYLPGAQEASAVGIACATCHDPHGEHAYTNVLTSPPGEVYTNQLRNPLSSLQDYHSTGSFATNYNAQINLCAQCHNDRGASWTNSSAPPHPSPQYNMLLGTVGELESGLPPHAPGRHALRIANQCVGCHMQTAPYVSPTQPATNGHKFTVDSFNLCFDCHSDPEGLLQFVQDAVSSQILGLKISLDTWATNKAPPALTAKYGTRAWEYTTPGALSPGGPGPDAAEQAQIPVNIQKARFNLYLTLYDGSFGAHNGRHFVTLLSTAQDWVNQELSP